MRRLFRILHWRARARFWERRAHESEARASAAEMQLKAEMYRNLTREDTFVSAAVLGSRGMWGLAPRTGPAQTPQARLTPALPADPWDSLTPADKMEFDTFYRRDAEAAGVPLESAKQKFMHDVIIPRRMPLNDDSFN